MPAYSFVVPQIYGGREGHFDQYSIYALTCVFRILISQIGFSRFKSDFRDSYRILASHTVFFESQIRFTHHFSKSYFRASNWIVISYFQTEFQFVRCKAAPHGLLTGQVEKQDTSGNERERECKFETVDHVMVVQWRIQDLKAGDADSGRAKKFC